jgi:hypothetical protein
MREYLESLKGLLDRHSSQQGAPYRVVMAVHPETEGSLRLDDLHPDRTAPAAQV